LNTLQSNIISNKKAKSNLYFSKILNRRLYSTQTNISSINNQLNSYLAGLIEGDGSIYTPLNNKIKALPHIEIAFDIRDLLLFEKIKENLGGGFITIRNNGQSGRLTIKKQAILLKLINLINGHMRTPKIEALYRLIN
jgi:hypothetical protein